VVSRKLETCSFSDITTRNPNVLAARKLAEHAAAVDQGALIIGEPGTEKDILAAAIHNAGPRAGKPFVALDCPYAAAALLEGAMFGGQIDAGLAPLMKKCAGGTLFLQEVGALPLPVQARIARAMQSGRLALDSGENVAFDCRVIASTSEDLRPAVEDRRFRHDLHDALAVNTLFISSLRHRKDDIPLLVHKYIDEFGRSLHKPLNNISDEAMNALVRYAWPGNVTELQTVIGRSAVLAKGEMILKDHLPKSIQRATREKKPALQDNDVLPLATIEKRHIQRVLDYTGWHKVRTAQILGIDRSTLYDKIRRYNLANPAEKLVELSEADRSL